MSEDSTRHVSNNPSALPPGTRLGEFELLSLLGVGGFGIVYLAFDHALEREVAIKEYMPASLAGRTETMHVSIRSQSDAESFALGLRSFVNEARLLAKFDHPSLLKVHRFWEGNGTAYMAMPVMRGRTVRDVRMDMPYPPDETWLRGLLDPLLGAIEKLHGDGVYHRDIAPDNIQIEPDGRPVLLDFGAARRVLSDKSQALTAILKPAYAPIEQYAEAGSVKQGPWTDIYALGATLHFLLLLRPPAPATARAIHDDESALTTMALPGCSENFLRIIDWMLAPRPADRPQSVAALRDVLDGRVATPLRRAPAQDQPSDWDRTVIVPASARTTLPPTAAATQFPPAQAPAPATAPTGPTAPVWPPQDDFDADATVILPTPTRAHTPTRVPPAPPPAPVPAPQTSAYVPPAHHPAPAYSAPTADAYGQGDTTVRMSVPVAAAATPAPTPAPSPSSTRVPPVKPVVESKSKMLPIALGVAGLAVVLAAVFALTRKPEQPAYAGEGATILSASSASSPAPLPAPAPVAPAPVPAPAESAVATVVVRGAAGTGTNTSGNPPVTTPSNPGAAVDPSLSKPVTPGAGVGVGTAPAKPAPKPNTPVKTATPTPSSTTPVVSTPTPEPVRAPAPEPVKQASVPAPEPAKPAAATSPEGVCAGKGGISYFVCMEKECLRAEQQTHADCKKWRRNARPEY